MLLRVRTLERELNLAGKGGYTIARVGDRVLLYAPQGNEPPKREGEMDFETIGGMEIILDDPTESVSLNHVYISISDGVSLTDMSGGRSELWFVDRIGNRQYFDFKSKRPVEMEPGIDYNLKIGAHILKLFLEK